jgi:hypothetical protein
MAKHSRPRPPRGQHVSWVKIGALAGGGALVLAAAALPGQLHRPAASPAPHSAHLLANNPPAGTTNDSAAALPSPMTAGEQQQLSNLLAAPQCTLNVPADPLSAAGLSQPWFLETATVPCAENAQTGAFVQATILDPATGALSVYYPLVVPDGHTPAVPIVPAAVPPGAVVTVWTGFNGNQLKLAGPGAAFFVNFAQQAWANSPQFFAALRTAVSGGLVHVPPLGTASDGLPCPSTRDFSIVDQDQSDNVPSAELVTAGGAVAQDNAVNRAGLPGAAELFNGSDQEVVNVVDGALGCSTWKVLNQVDPAVTAPSAPLQEEQAAEFQGYPPALVPGLDDFVTNNGQPPPAGRPDLFLQNLYRLQVGQPETGNGNDTARYCALLGLVGEPRLQLDYDTESRFPVPTFVAGTGLNAALALANRFSVTWTMLACQRFTGVPSPIQVTLSGNTAVAATYNPYRGRMFGLQNIGS